MLKNEREVRGRHVLFGRSNRRSKNKNDIVDVISGYVRLQKKVVPISDSVRFTMKSPPLFRKQRKADVLLLWLWSGRKCIYISDGL